MTVTVGQMSVLDLAHAYRKVSWRRWRSGMAGGNSEALVTVGYLPDGRWYVADTRINAVRTFAGDNQVEVRAAARRQAGRLMRGRRWRRIIAVFEPGVIPARAAVVADWPAGHEPVS